MFCQEAVRSFPICCLHGIPGQVRDEIDAYCYCDSLPSRIYPYPLAKYVEVQRELHFATRANARLCKIEPPEALLAPAVPRTQKLNARELVMEGQCIKVLNVGIYVTTFYGCMLHSA